jgi:hypothetical protein
MSALASADPTDEWPRDPIIEKMKLSKSVPTTDFADPIESRDFNPHFVYRCVEKQSLRLSYILRKAVIKNGVHTKTQSGDPMFIYKHIVLQINSPTARALYASCHGLGEAAKNKATGEEYAKKLGVTLVGFGVDRLKKRKENKDAPDEYITDESQMREMEKLVRALQRVVDDNIWYIIDNQPCDKEMYDKNFAGVPAKMREDPAQLREMLYNYYKTNYKTELYELESDKGEKRIANMPRTATLTLSATPFRDIPLDPKTKTRPVELFENKYPKAHAIILKKDEEDPHYAMALEVRKQHSEGKELKYPEVITKGWLLNPKWGLKGEDDYVWGQVDYKEFDMRFNDQDTMKGTFMIGHYCHGVQTMGLWSRLLRAENYTNKPYKPYEKKGINSDVDVERPPMPLPPAPVPKKRLASAAADESAQRENGDADDSDAESYTTRMQTKRMRQAPPEDQQEQEAGNDTNNNNSNTSEYDLYVNGGD